MANDPYKGQTKRELNKTQEQGVFRFNLTALEMYSVYTAIVCCFGQSRCYGRERGQLRRLSTLPAVSYIKGQFLQIIEKVICNKWKEKKQKSGI